MDYATISVIFVSIMFGLSIIYATKQLVKIE